MTTTYDITENTGPDFEAAWQASYDRGFIRFDAHDGPTFVGRDHNRLTVLSASTNTPVGIVLTVHEEGGTYWSGLGLKRSYAPASISTIVVQPPQGDNASWKYYKLISVDASSNAENRKSANDAAVAVLTKLAEEVQS